MRQYINFPLKFLDYFKDSIQSFGFHYVILIHICHYSCLFNLPSPLHRLSLITLSVSIIFNTYLMHGDLQPGLLAMPCRRDFLVILGGCCVLTLSSALQSFSSLRSKADSAWRSREERVVESLLLRALRIILHLMQAACE